MVALSIDTAANLCAVAVSNLNSGKILKSVSHDIGRGHAELLMETIDDCLEQAGCEYSQIERIITATGPGSFTGVRVGLATARGLGLGLSKPVIGVSNLHACAAYALECHEGHSKSQRVSVILDARRDQVYFQQFENQAPVSDARICLSRELVDEHDGNHSGDIILCGSGAEAFQQELSSALPDIEYTIAHHGATAPIETIAALGMVAAIEESRPEPLYLRGPDAKKQAGFAVMRQGLQNAKVIS